MGLHCAIFGHRVNNRNWRWGRGLRHCDCGEAFLNDEGGETRIGHVFKCFFGGHRYRRVGSRHGHNEYACIRCGHPLLIDEAADMYPAQGIFKKRVNYACGLFGHNVHRVTARRGVTEYACGCGHTFLREEARASEIHHPMKCVLAGHFVRCVGAHAGLSEYLCRNCGHPFLFTQRAGPAEHFLIEE